MSTPEEVLAQVIPLTSSQRERELAEAVRQHVSAQHRPRDQKPDPAVLDQLRRPTKGEAP